MSEEVQAPKSRLATSLKFLLVVFLIGSIQLCLIVGPYWVLWAPLFALALIVSAAQAAKETSQDGKVGLLAVVTGVLSGCAGGMIYNTFLVG